MEERLRSFTISNKIRRNFSSSNNIDDYPSSLSSPLEDQTSSPLEEQVTSQQASSLEESLPPKTFPGSKVSNIQKASSPTLDISNSTLKPTASIISDVNIPSKPSSTTSLRRSTRSNKGIRTSTDYINQVFLSSMSMEYPSSQQEFLAYQAELSTDLDSGIIDCTDARVYLTKSKLKDPDQPSFLQAMNGHDSEKWIEAMKLEIADLLARNTWKRVHKHQILRDKDGRKYSVLKSICVFKLKRLPDGTLDRDKSRFCVRGDMQREGIDYFITYEPVVKWSTICCY